jgi:hypothetical protein
MGELKLIAFLLGMESYSSKFKILIETYFKGFKSKLTYSTISKDGRKD